MIHATSEGPKFLTKFSNGSAAGLSDIATSQGGTGTGFRPHELLEAAVVATCVNMTIRVYAQTLGLPLEDVSTEVQLDRTSANESILRYKVDLKGDQLSSQQRAKLLNAAKACPVKKTLSKAIRFEPAEYEEPAIIEKTGSGSVAAIHQQT
jgi:putative redox protein